ncbi:MAG: DEAD/DEAH box helicase, partial [Lachnospiraceae bacterium]|nr:DEAD/DEAH box helicase [Lachnospiraceae bacterium]
PLIRETRRECMQELWDAEGVKELLWDIRAGIVEVREVYTEIPSPMSLPLQWGQEAAVMYDYFPTPRGIHGAIEEALKQEKELIVPDSRELAQMAAREKLPENEGQLHSLLMTEGDLAAGELEIPAEWLDSLAKAGRVKYLEQGLWIAAEHEEEYALALEEKEWEKRREATDEREAQLHIVRRMLRYRGGADAVQTAVRYGWAPSFAEALLKELCEREEAVKQEERYYHAVLYRRARRRTLKNRREEIQTCPPENYAALLLSQTDSGAPALECLQNTLKRYAGAAFLASYWESILLPNRVKNYRETLLDSFLAEGELFWHMEEKKNLRFDYLADVDWDTDIKDCAKDLTEKERIIYEALLKRGASFLQSLNGLLSGESPYDTLLSLLEKGLVCADSYV